MPTKRKLTAGERIVRDLAREIEAKVTRLRNKARLVAGDPTAESTRNLTALRNTAAELDDLLHQIQLRRCRVCGCTDYRACDGGCEWVGKDLCSACKESA